MKLVNDQGSMVTWNACIYLMTELVIHTHYTYNERDEQLRGKLFKYIFLILLLIIIEDDTVTVLDFVPVERNSSCICIQLGFVYFYIYAKFRHN